jgi:hypothetical protein
MVNMKNLKIILAIIALLVITSCGAYYRIVTVLDKNGNTQREIYANGKIEETTGEFSKNPFLFEADSSWNIHRFDSVISYNFFGDIKELNIKITKRAETIDLFTKDIIYYDNEQPLAVPEEVLFIKNRWFYTNYLFKATYQKFQYDAPVSIHNYLSKEEQILWTQGDLRSYKLMNGSEMNDYLNQISGKFMKWYGHNLFEISFECVKKLNKNYDLEVCKENIYKHTVEFVNEDLAKIEPSLVCKVLDSYFRTHYFSKLYKENEALLDDEFDKAIAIEAQITIVISYELVIQGNIIHTNAPVVASDTLIWKIDGTRLLFDDFTLSAEYRIVNYWALWITGLLIFVAVFIFIKTLNRKS